MLSARSMGCFQTNKRIKTAGYRRVICLLAVKDYYRSAAEVFNNVYHRLDTESELHYGTLSGDIEQEGEMLKKVKKETAQSILKRFGFDPETGLYTDGEFPDAYKNNVCEMITINPEEIMQGFPSGWEAENVMDPSALAKAEIGTEVEEATFDKYSQPDMEEFHVNPKRRGKRVEVDADQKEDVCVSFVRWYNSVTKHKYYGIINETTIEKGSNDVVYISIDAVYVNKQAPTRKTSTSSGEAQKEDEKRIGHMNIKVECGNCYYFITSTDTTESFRELTAVILENELCHKYMIFMTDGEKAINDKIKMYYWMWDYHVELDWIHLEHKCYDRLSNAIKGKRVPDPRGVTEYYKRGAKKGQVKSQEHTSQSRLYARALSRILWPGNKDEAIHFLENIDPNVVSKQSEIDQLKTYIENKRDWIPNYALKKKTGLKNSSNGVEGQNNSNVAKRQKNNGTSWRPGGSGDLAAIKTMFDNHEEEEWFIYGRISFKMVDRSLLCG